MDVFCVVATIGLSSNSIMETFSLEEDNSGIFITKNGNDNYENCMDVSVGDDFVFPPSQVQGGDGVSHMQYSDISDEESQNYGENISTGEPNFD